MIPNRTGLCDCAVDLSNKAEPASSFFSDFLLRCLVLFGHFRQRIGYLAAEYSRQPLPLLCKGVTETRRRLDDCEICFYKDTNCIWSGGDGGGRLIRDGEE